MLKGQAQRQETFEPAPFIIIVGLKGQCNSFSNKTVLNKEVVKTMLRDDFKGREEESDRNFEEDNLSGQNMKDKTLENTPVKVLTASSIIGDKVENSKGENLGDIRDIMLNLNTGCIEYVVLEFGGFLGIGEKFFAVPFSALTLHAERQIFLINKDKQTLKEAPGFDKDHWPETNDRHFQDVNRYWSNNQNSGYTL